MEHAENNLGRLLAIITEITAGGHSGRIMELTGPEVAEPVRTIAEAIGLMMVKIETREHQLATLVEQLEAANEQIRLNIIAAGTKWDAECVAAFERIIPKIPSHAVSVRAPQGRLLSLPEDRQSGIRLEPGPPGGAKLRWLKPGIDFATFKRLVLDRVVFFFAADSEYKGMDPAELKHLADGFHRRVADALAGAYPLVKTPAHDVARLRFAITDLKQNRPILLEGEVHQVGDGGRRV